MYIYIYVCIYKNKRLRTWRTVCKPCCRRSVACTTYPPGSSRGVANCWWDGWYFVLRTVIVPAVDGTRSPTVCVHDLLDLVLQIGQLSAFVGVPQRVAGNTDHAVLDGHHDVDAVIPRRYAATGGGILIQAYICCMQKFCYRDNVTRPCLVLRLPDVRVGIRP